MWGEKIVSINDIQNIFLKFIKKQIKYIPWCDSLDNETNEIAEDLLKINEMGYWTINSQPRLNGVKSNNSNGWGGENGYLYQKQYLEFFTSKDNLDKLLNKIKNNKNISYCAVNNKDNLITNCNNDTIALTWGVFPNKEIIQPTIANKSIFLNWKKDAFQIWINEWAYIYDEDLESFNFLKKTMNDYYLVFLIDNNYIDGDLFQYFC